MHKKTNKIYSDVFNDITIHSQNNRTLKKINNKYGTNFTKLKGFFKGINFTKYLLNNHLLIVNNKTKKEIFYKLNR